MRAFDASRVGAAVAGATVGAAPATSDTAARSGTGYPRTRGVLTPCMALSGAESGTRTHRHRVALEPRSRGAPGARVNADNANATRTRLLWGASAKHRPAVRPSWEESPKRRADRQDPDDAPEANGLGPLGNGLPVRDRTGLPKRGPRPGTTRMPRGGRPRQPQFKHRRHMPAHRGAVPTIARSVDPAMTITPWPGLEGTDAGGWTEPEPPNVQGMRPPAAALRRGLERADTEALPGNVAASTLASCTPQNTRGGMGFHAYPGASGGIAATRPEKGHSCPRTPTARRNAPTLCTRGQPHFTLIPNGPRISTVPGKASRP